MKKYKNLISKNSNRIISIFTATLMIFTAVAPIFAESTKGHVNATPIFRDLTFKHNGKNYYTSEKTSPTGEVYFCMEAHKYAPNNVDLPEGGQLDDVAYRIMKYGYPNKSFTGDKRKDRVITQGAFWGYVDKNIDINKLVIYNRGKADNDLTKKMRDLYNRAKVGKENQKLTIKFSNNMLRANFDGTNYVTDYVQVNVTGDVKSGKFSMESKDLPKGVKFQDEKGNSLTTILPNQKFRVIIPGNTKEKSLQLRAIGELNTIKSIWYDSDKPTVQDVAKLTERKVNQKSLDALNVVWDGGGDFTIIKRNEYGDLLDGATFEVSQEQKNPKTGAMEDVVVATKTTSGGKVTFDKLNGTYTLKETKAPVGHVLDSTEKTINVTPAGATQVIENKVIKGKVKVIKSDNEIPYNITGAEFSIYDKDGNMVEVLKTVDGVATSDWLKYGDYTMRETRQAEGYLPNDKVYNIQIRENEKTYEYNIKNQIIKGKLQIVKIDTDNEEVPVEGATFAIIADSVVGVKKGTVCDTVTSNEDGFAFTKDLRYGRYLIRETHTPSGFIPPTRDTILSVTENNKLYVKYVGNDPVLLKLRVLKMDEDGKNIPIANTKFKIVDKKWNEDVEFTYFDGIEPINTTVLTTDEKGEIVTPQPLRAGTYDLVEVKPAEGYLPIEPIEFDVTSDTPFEDVELLGRVMTIPLGNNRIKGNMELLKVDRYTKEPMPNVTFKITCTDGFIKGKTFTEKSDAKGKIYLKNIEYGKYKIDEIETLESHVLNTKPILFEIKNNGETVKLEMDNKIIEGDVKLIKKDLETKRKLIGAKFELYRGDKLIGEYKTDKKGEINVKKLQFGHYYFKEIEAPPGYKLSDKTYPFYIHDEGKLITVEAFNKPEKRNLDFDKKDMATGEVIEGATIQIKGLEERNKHINITFISHANGNRFDLPTGKYEIKETKPPEGYILNEEVGHFEIKENGKVVKSEIKNAPILGEVELTKIDEKSKATLIGAEFELCKEGKNENTGELEDKLIDKYTTDSEGKIKVKKLNYGKYYFKEVKAPNGFTFDKENNKYAFFIKDNKESIEITATNKPIEGEILFEKTDIATGKVIEGATIQINGTSDNNKHIKIEFVSSKDGNKFKVPAGKYEIVETIAPNGYILSKEKEYFEIKEDGQVVKAQLKNKLKEGSLDFIKTDFATGEKIEGATIEIECLEGLDKGKVVGYVSSKKEERISLKAGKYKITEKIAPTGYEKTEEVGDFEIKEDGQIVKANIKNKKIPTPTKPTEKPKPKPEPKPKPMIEIKVKNPKTGDAGLLIASTIAVGSLGGLLGFNIYNRSQYEYYYEDDEELEDEQ